jgi:hypothetical protein
MSIKTSKRELSQCHYPEGISAMWYGTGVMSLEGEGWSSEWKLIAAVF